MPTTWVNCKSINLIKEFSARSGGDQSRQLPYHQYIDSHLQPISDEWSLILASLTWNIFIVFVHFCNFAKIHRNYDILIFWPERMQILVDNNSISSFSSILTGLYVFCLRDMEKTKSVLNAPPAPAGWQTPAIMVPLPRVTDGWDVSNTTLWPPLSHRCNTQRHIVQCKDVLCKDVLCKDMPCVQQQPLVTPYCWGRQKDLSPSTQIELSCSWWGRRCSFFLTMQCFPILNDAIFRQCFWQNIDLDVFGDV